MCVIYDFFIKLQTFFNITIDLLYQYDTIGVVIIVLREL